jgi:hypothetical protein
MMTHEELAKQKTIAVLGYEVLIEQAVDSEILDAFKSFENHVEDALEQYEKLKAAKEQEAQEYKEKLDKQRDLTNKYFIELNKRKTIEDPQHQEENNKLPDFKEIKNMLSDFGL